MAEVVDALPPKETAKPKGSKWDQFLDGQVWKLQPGVDHDGTAQRLALVLRKRGSRLGLSVAIRFKDGFVFVQAAPVSQEVER